MYAGFDFGTSNCAIGVVNSLSDQLSIQLLPINEGQPFMPTMIYAQRRELICEAVGLQLNDSAKADYMSLRQPQLSSARRVRLEDDIMEGEEVVFVGQQAFTQYLSFPGEGYFVKSIKSFLGSSGLQPVTIEFFEDIVTAIMLHIKQHAEQQLKQPLAQAVIGRPVNFQGIDTEQSNRQAVSILTTSAKRAGFKSVEFLFEPIAAGLDFEASLTQDKTVLVVDVGGGTTDCSMVRLGPSHRQKQDRTADFLGHTGERVGGNDFDIRLAAQNLMPLFGMGSVLTNGLDMPSEFFWDAVSTNNVGAQTNFNSAQTTASLQQYLLDSAQPELIQRFIRLRDEQQNHHLVRSAEQAKISLSENHECQVNLEYIENALSAKVSRQQFAKAIEPPLTIMLRLINEAIAQAGCQPDFIYITGGSAKLPIIRHRIEKSLGKIDIIDGDHFGSVAKGLTVWAQKLFM